MKYHMITDCLDTAYRYILVAILSGILWVLLIISNQMGTPESRAEAIKNVSIQVAEEVLDKKLFELKSNGDVFMERQ